MACFRPYQAWKAKSGKGVTFSRSQAFTDLPPLTLPCGQCIGCRMQRSQDWATRIAHEAQYHDATCFLTLTFSDEHLPENGSISVRDLQLFNKRLRKLIGAFRFFACGEYGGKYNRPHYHMILFGHDFSKDRTPWRKTPTGFVTYRSATLEKAWPFGHSEIGSVSTASAGYVARYCLKKVTGDEAEQHYTRINAETGEVFRVSPEFITMSTKPGIGRKWCDEFKCDIYPSDFVTIDGQKRQVPRYYVKQLTEDERDEVSTSRSKKGKLHAANNTPERLAVREELQEIRAARLHRELEDEQ